MVELKKETIEKQEEKEQTGLDEIGGGFMKRLVGVQSCVPIGKRVMDL